MNSNILHHKMRKKRFHSVLDKQFKMLIVGTKKKSTENVARLSCMISDRKLKPGITVVKLFKPQHWIIINL